MKCHPKGADYEAPHQGIGCWGRRCHHLRRSQYSERFISRAWETALGFVIMVAVAKSKQQILAALAANVADSERRQTTAEAHPALGKL
jgi:hypothetical protein